MTTLRLGDAGLSAKESHLSDAEGKLACLLDLWDIRARAHDAVTDTADIYARMAVYAFDPSMTTAALARLIQTETDNVKRLKTLIDDHPHSIAMAGIIHGLVREGQCEIHFAKKTTTPNGAQKRILRAFGFKRVSNYIGEVCIDVCEQ